MSQTFQETIDAALKNVPRNTVESDVHFRPVSEDIPQIMIEEALKDRPSFAQNGKKLHIGTAGGMNFSIACKTKPDRILLLDINKNQEIFWKEIVTLLKENRHPWEFIEAYQSKQFSVAIRDAKGSLYHYMNKADWQSDEKTYLYLHKMAKQGHIAVATLDLIHDEQAAQVLGATLKQQGWMADTCYWSNIASFIRPIELTGTKPGEGMVFGTPEQGLVYAPKSFYTGGHFNKAQSDAERVSKFQPAQWKGEPTSNRDKLPMFEKMMRNISALGRDPHSMHILTSTEKPYADFIEGPPRDPEQRRQSWREKHLTRGTEKVEGSYDMDR